MIPPRPTRPHILEYNVLNMSYSICTHWKLQWAARSDCDAKLPTGVSHTRVCRKWIQCFVWSNQTCWEQANQSYESQNLQAMKAADLVLDVHNDNFADKNRCTQHTCMLTFLLSCCHRDTTSFPASTRMSPYLYSTHHGSKQNRDKENTMLASYISSDRIPDKEQKAKQPTSKNRRRDVKDQKLGPQPFFCTNHGLFKWRPWKCRFIKKFEFWIQGLIVLSQRPR